jgi:hypothetical protein
MQGNPSVFSLKFMIGKFRKKEKLASTADRKSLQSLVLRAAFESILQSQLKNKKDLHVCRSSKLREPAM